MMKQTLTTLMVAFCYTLFAQPCDSDLIGHYTFDDQTAIDSSSYVNDGTLFKVTPTVDRFGNSNKAYLFDGDSSHIALPSNMLDKQAMTIS
ncbi:MAG: hypothetical protein GY810_15550, partial [Aureispira sp.]|nr:hypothetical protein [Aureispira sp.]